MDRYQSSLVSIYTRLNFCGDLVYALLGVSRLRSDRDLRIRV